MAAPGEKGTQSGKVGFHHKKLLDGGKLGSGKRGRQTEGKRKARFNEFEKIKTEPGRALKGETKSPNATAGNMNGGRGRGKVTGV